MPSLAIHDTMRYVKSDVSTLAFGGAMGMMGFLLAVGAKVRADPSAVIGTQHARHAVSCTRALCGMGAHNATAPMQARCTGFVVLLTAGQTMTGADQHCQRAYPWLTQTPATSTSLPVRQRARLDRHITQAPDHHVGGLPNGNSSTCKAGEAASARPPHALQRAGNRQHSASQGA